MPGQSDSLSPEDLDLKAMDEHKFPADIDRKCFFLTHTPSMTINKVSTLLAYGMALTAIKNDYLTATSVVPRPPKDRKIPYLHDVKPYPETMRLKPNASGDFPRLEEEYAKIFICTKHDNQKDVKAARDAWTEFVLDICHDIKRIERNSLHGDMASVITFIESVEGLSEFLKAFPWICFLLFHPDGQAGFQTHSPDLEERGRMKSGEIVPTGFSDPYKLWCKHYRDTCSSRDLDEADFNFEHLYHTENFAGFVHLLDEKITAYASHLTDIALDFTYKANDDCSIKSNFGDYTSAE